MESRGFDLSNLKYPITVGISGASGTIYAIRTLQFLLENNYRIDLVISDGAIKVAQSEINLEFSNNPEILKEQVLSYLENASKKKIQRAFLNVWSNNDISAPIASGSYRTLGMIIIPASMGTVSAIANGTSDNLLTRAADVCLKERGKLVLVPREMPYSTIHLENLLKLSRTGVIIAPASPAFYHNPIKLDHAIDFVVGKTLDLFGIDHNLFKRWKEEYREVNKI
jgi:4-hydroxy-3-polyprenylbenzoate decarboxylase